MTLWLTLFLAPVALAAGKNTRAPERLSLTPKRITQGQVALLRVAVGGSDVTASAGEQSITLFDCPDAKVPTRCGFVAAKADQKPGKVDVFVTWSADGKTHTDAAVLVVKAGKFKTSRLKVEPKITSPSPEDLKRIEREKAETSAIYAAPDETPHWEEGFALPGKGSLTSKFGGRRMFNGEVRSIHQGVDLRAGVGEPVYAANAGRVALAKETFYAGNCVILDHGMGIFTVYAHLSAFDVSTGQAVKKGQLLGKAGATGRVTGPHIHWAMRVNNVLVDPLQLRDVFNRLWRKS